LDKEEAKSKTFAAVTKHFHGKQKLRLYLIPVLDKAIFGGADVPSVVALNGGKGWYKRYDGNITEKDIIAWIDSVKMGEGKKIAVSDDVKKLLGLSDGETREDTKRVTEEKLKLVFEEEPAKHDEL
jgi:hypothetical protein